MFRHGLAKEIGLSNSRRCFEACLYIKWILAVAFIRNAAFLAKLRGSSPNPHLVLPPHVLFDDFLLWYLHSSEPLLVLRVTCLSPIIVLQIREEGIALPLIVPFRNSCEQDPIGQAWLF